MKNLKKEFLKLRKKVILLIKMKLKIFLKMLILIKMEKLIILNLLLLVLKEGKKLLRKDFMKHFLLMIKKKKGKLVKKIL